MALIKIFRYEFVITSGAFTAGDILEVFADDTLIITPAGALEFKTDGLSVELNGASYPASGAGGLPINAYGITYYNLQVFNDNFCSGTSLVRFQPYGTFLWPYAYYYSEENHFSCAVNPPTCDLIVNGSPTVTPASDETTADGSITVVATSTYPIQGKLNQPFVYGDGVSSLTFSGLLAGNYVVYLRDSKNCQVNLQVTVPVGNTYGTYYRLEYYDYAGFHTKIDVTKRGYSGAVTEACGSDTPLLIDLRGEASTDKFEPVLPSQAVLNLTSETEGAFETLYTSDRNLYRIEYYKDTGSGYSKMWTGKILPFMYSEELKAPPYYISVTASDGLPELKDLYLVQPDGQKFFGTDSLMTIIAFCLKKIGLELNIRCGINLYAVNGPDLILNPGEAMDNGAADDPLDQAYVDYECFYLNKGEPDLWYVLQSILEAFNATIIQWDDCWNIIRREENLTSYDYREFDSDGVYVSNSSYNPVKSIESPVENGFMWLSSPNMELRPGYGNIKVKYKLGLKPNLIDNGDFRLRTTYFPQQNVYSFSVNTDGFSIVNGGYPLTQGYEKIDDGNVAFYISGGEDMLTNTGAGTAYIQTSSYFVRMGTNNQIKINLRYKIKRASVIFSGTVYQVEVPYVKVRMRVKYGSLYLQNDGNWTSTETILTFHITTLNEYVESEITANQPASGTPVDGMNFDIRLYHAYAYHVDFQTVATLKALATYTGGSSVLPTGYKTELRDTFTALAPIYYYQLEENTDSPSGYSIIRPDDYHVTNNPRQWILKYQTNVGTVTGANIFAFYIDRIKGTYLTDGKEPIDTIIRTATGEALNNELFEKEIIIGSYSEVIVTAQSFSLDLGYFFPDSGGSISQTFNTLVPDLIYTGWLRNSEGDGFEFFKRDAFDEVDKLHGIWLKSYAAQYQRSWRLLRGGFISKTGFFGLLDVIYDTNYGNKIYAPVALSIDDRRNSVSGEFLEIINTGVAAESGSPFSSGFSDGFGKNFN